MLQPELGIPRGHSGASTALGATSGATTTSLSLPKHPRATPEPGDKPTLPGH